MISTKAIADIIYKEVEKIAKKKCQEGASYAADQLTLEATKAMYEFYGSYTPEMYSRSGGLLNSYKRYYYNKHGNIYKGGVEITESSSGYHSVVTHDGVDSGFVTLLAWYAGRHGFAEALPEYYHVSNYPPVMSPTPYEMVIEKLPEIEKKVISVIES